MTRRTLVTGGVRSGKSRYAEELLADIADVTYVAPGPNADPDVDPEWSARVAAHRLRRPPSWQTVETSDITAVLRDAPGGVLIDCLGTWLTAVIDEMDVWDRPLATWLHDFETRLDAAVEAWRAAAGPLVAVTNEVGLGVVPEHRSGRLFRDLLGVTNQQFAAECDDVVLVIAGRSITL